MASKNVWLDVNEKGDRHYLILFIFFERADEIENTF